jgi:hypothetical protein
VDEPTRRGVLIAITFPVVMAALIAPLAVFDVDQGTSIGLVLLAAAAFGAVVARWWALAFPTAWVVIAYVVLMIWGPTDDDPAHWGQGVLYNILVLALPLTVAMLPGVLIGKTRQPRRSAMTAGRPARSVETFLPPR